jgi:type I restriction enzyme S subunit
MSDVLFFETQPLSSLFRINTLSIIPNSQPDDIFYHHSIPAFDKLATAVIEKGISIESNKTHILKPSVLVSKLNPRKSRVSLVFPNIEEKHCCSTEFICYEPLNDKLELSFWRHFFGSTYFKSKLTKVAIGSTNSHTRASPKETLKWDVPVISRLESHKIGLILDTLDNQIRETNAIITKLQLVKQGLAHDLLTRGVDENGELRSTYEQAPELYKPSELGWIPKGWDIKSIEELGGFVTSGSRDWAQYYSDDGDLFIRIGNLSREHINFRFDKLQCVSPPQHGDGQRTKLVSGDILISITADLGIIGVMSDEIGTAYINQHVAMVRFSNEDINPRFIGHFLASKAFQMLLSAKNDVGAKAGLNLPSVRGFLVLTLKNSEQNEITNRLDSMDFNIEIERLLLRKLKLKKTGLMDDLLTGKIRVTDLINQQTIS